MTIKRKEVATLLDGINSINSSKLKVKTVFDLVVNKKRLTTEAENIKETHKEIFEDSEFANQIKEFDKKRIAICEEFSEKDDRGNAKKIKLPPVNGRPQEEYDILPEKKNEFEKQVSELKKQYQSAFDQEKVKIEEIQNFLEEEVELELKKIKLEDLPDPMTINQMSLLFPIIKQDSELIEVTKLPVLNEEK
jgi:hypothetical protein